MLTRREFISMAGGALLLLAGCRPETSLEFMRRKSEDYRKDPLEKNVPVMINGTIIQNDNDDLDLRYIEAAFETLYSDLGGINRPLVVHYVNQTEEDLYGTASVVYRDSTMHVNISTAISFNKTDEFYKRTGLSRPDFLTALSFNLSGTTASELYLASRSAVTETGIVGDTSAARIFGNNYRRSMMNGDRSLLIVVDGYRRAAESVR